MSDWLITTTQRIASSLRVDPYREPLASTRPQGADFESEFQALMAAGLERASTDAGATAGRAASAQAASPEHRAMARMSHAGYPLPHASASSETGHTTRYQRGTPKAAETRLHRAVAASASAPVVAAPAGGAASAAAATADTAQGASPSSAPAAADRFAIGSPQAAALASPESVYLHGGAANGNPDGASFTPAQARQWWDQWFANPVDLAGVRPTLLPGSLVLTPEELARAQALQAAGNTLPKAPADYNPLSLAVIA